MNVIKNCRHGLMLYNTNDIWIGRSLTQYGEFSQGEVELFQELIKPGMLVIDIGANIGTHTVPFAKLVGHKGLVFAYEPQRIVYYCLCANVALNNLTNVHCLRQAVGNAEGSIDVPELDFRKPNNFGGLELGKVSGTPVKLTKLDNLKLPRLDFIKIDVEGMELDVIKGAESLISKYRPLIYMEVDRPDSVETLTEMMQSLDYETYSHKPPLFNPDNYIGNEQNVFGNIVSINMLCHPKELEFNSAKLGLT
jgi:FkbM family methyltransferase